MRFLAIADIHGHLSAVEKFREFAESFKPDFIVVCGDLTSFGGRESTERMLKPLEKWRVFAIPGNLDSMEVLEFLEEKGLSIHGKLVEVEGKKIAGFGGGVEGAKIMHGQMLFSEEEIKGALEGLFKEGRVDILVTHSPPFETTIDKAREGVHIGSRAVKEIIEKFRPGLCICGHVHEAPGVEWLGKSLCVNVGPLKHGSFASVSMEERVEVKMEQLG